MCAVGNKPGNSRRGQTRPGKARLGQESKKKVTISLKYIKKYLNVSDTHYSFSLMYYVKSSKLILSNIFLLCQYVWIPCMIFLEQTCWHSLPFLFKVICPAIQTHSARPSLTGCLTESHISQ